MHAGQVPTVLWFRRDLRLGDLPSLAAAAREDKEVLACFVFDPRLQMPSGARRLRFLCDSLRALRDVLDGRIFITQGKPHERIPAIAKEIGASAVHVSEEFTPFGRRRDAAVRAALDDVPLVATGSPYLVSPTRISKPDGTAFRVFTPFYRRWHESDWRAPAATGAHSASWIDPGHLDHGIEIPTVDVELDVEAGETAALRRWETFVDAGLERYAKDRNRLDHNATSRMSAHLHAGTIHPRTLVADLDPRHGGHQAYLRELAFRDFYASVVHHWPHSAWQNWNRQFDAMRTESGAAATKAFECWKAGRTGFPIVDAGMRQLRATGFMPNRVRMITASFLVKDLHLPWQWGARWFMDQLVDGDLANNQHGWQWTAGSGTDAAPYFRVFNPVTQGEKFDQDGDYVRRWVPELKDVVDVHDLDGNRPRQYPEPIVDHAHERKEALRRYGLLTSPTQETKGRARR